MAAMLDELMGPERNVPLDQRTNRKRHFTDPDTCKYYICGLSPHLLFKNTKSADDVYRVLGDYTATADPDVKAEWDQLEQSKKDEYGYEHELWQLLEKLVGECDKRISRANERIKRDLEHPLYSVEDSAKLEGYKAQIKLLTQQTEDAAEAGDIDTAQEIMEKIEVQKKVMEAFEKTMQPEKTLAVCPISGVYMSSTDNEQRHQDHLMGKQFQGWKKIREKLDELRKQQPPRKGSRPVSSRENEGTRRESEKSRDRGKDRSRERTERDRSDKDRDRDRSHRDKSEKDRDRDRTHRDKLDKDRDRDRSHRERSDKDRERSDQDRDRQNQRGKDHNDRERDHRDKDRGRDRSDRHSSQRNGSRRSGDQR